MFVAFMPLYILLCHEVLLYFFVNRNCSKFKFEFNSNKLVFYKCLEIKKEFLFSIFFCLGPNLTQVKGLALTWPNSDVNPSPNPTWLRLT
jgi:hypothetical protein